MLPASPVKYGGTLANMHKSSESEQSGSTHYSYSSISDPPATIGGVLLVGGASGTGKTSLAKAIALERHITWVQVDDLRLALQWSNIRLPTREATDALYFLERTPDVWSLPAQRLCDALIAVGEVMTEAIAIVVANHIARTDPAVIEGDAILPSLMDHPSLRGYVATGELKAVFVEAISKDELLRSHINRGRGVTDKSDAELRQMAEMNWLYSQWLKHQAQRRSLSVIPSDPFGSLAERVSTIWHSPGDLPGV